MKYIQILFVLIILLLFSGCFGRVQWEERQGGEENKINWIPVCPNCKFAIDYDRLQCNNPKCYTLLTWQDKIIYPENQDSWLEDEQLAATQREEDKEKAELRQKQKDHHLLDETIESSDKTSTEKLAEEELQQDSQDDDTEHSQEKPIDSSEDDSPTTSEDSDNDDDFDDNDDDDWNFDEDAW